MTDMTKPYDGGPAFPPMHDPKTHESGMSLRDWFAGMALSNAYTSHDADPDRVAQWAYQVADAMLGTK